MFENGNGQSGNDQNGGQIKDQSSLGVRIANMLRTPQASGRDDGDFVNSNLALRVDPATGIAYRVHPGLIGSSANGRDGQNGLNGNGQTASSPGPSGQSSMYLPPIQTRDPQGKTLPKYRMGIGHRILATVANFANGFAGNSAAPVYVGPGALNQRYYQDETARQQVNEENAGLQRNSNQSRNVIDWRTIGQDPATKKWYGNLRRREARTGDSAVGCGADWG